MKLKIALAGYAGSEGNLISLQNPVPNGDFHYFGINPISHTPTARRLNDQLNKPSTIKRTKKKAVEAEQEMSIMEEDGDGLGDKSADNGKNVLPDGADMYYGLKPLEHNPISNMVLGSNHTAVSAEFGSFFGLGDDVWFQLKSIQVPARVLAITFLPGKVLYSLAVETGFEPTIEYAGTYGLTNSIGWDDQGVEYIRVSNVDSVFVTPRSVKNLEVK